MQLSLETTWVRSSHSFDQYNPEEIGNNKI